MKRLAALLLVLSTSNALAGGFSSCLDPYVVDQAQDMLISALKRGGRPNVQLIGMSGLRSNRNEATSFRETCVANVFTNAGLYTLVFSLELANDGKWHLGMGVQPGFS